jgi:hypothetical protein
MKNHFIVALHFFLRFRGSLISAISISKLFQCFQVYYGCHFLPKVEILALTVESTSTSNPAQSCKANRIHFSTNIIVWILVNLVLKINFNVACESNL